MKLRAVIFDLYGTLLQVDPPTAGSEERWQRCWQELLGTAPPLSWPAFVAACREATAAEHRAARARGIPFPEVYWPGIVDVALETCSVSLAGRGPDFPLYGGDWLHTTRLMPGAAEALRAAQRAALPLGLASNCQPYSLRELDRALGSAGLDRGAFADDLGFFSFECGFSKPDPHVFQLLAARLRARGIAPGETLMVGDRIDHDFAPARACGWQAFTVRPGVAEDWIHLRDLFSRS